ncbi:Methylated-DNA--[protein]-cysteine S-methyltransferase [Saliniradius amylolyticus]|uniref:Methylated-DNA--protein-cysteine methyltransferase n=1 Tax=Saliniradius amylolyticus TaxID=2183582 RepID=A0A2S2E0U9_9ALTE|nr:methylated-DNA--[protein]-cysteine S-methyltransferase [Saliniradius amylolyticus]AWL11264.1 Methylated-DNA--[protein]-cysteine S-methyltransferase [Saliniradius amylolyticus]
MNRYTIFNSPLGPVTLQASSQALSGAWFTTHTSQPEELGQRDDEFALLVEAIAQLQAYFAGRCQSFDLPVAPRGSEFQQQVWQALQGIPYGETRSYQDIANAIDNPNAVRAVGLANGKNPLSIIVPCHRVIGKNGKLTGYAGGLDRKRALLTLEGCLTKDG